MQTCRGKEARSLCKHEFQYFIRYFVHPLLMKTVNDRILAERQHYLQTGEWNTWSDGQGKEWTFEQLVYKWSQKLHDAYRALQQGHWKKHSKVDVECYAPTFLPYFFSCDNCKAHSFWIKLRSKHLSREQLGTSLLQGLRINPHGHDVHQVVEHAIGCAKSNAATVLKEAKGNQVPLSTGMLWDAVQAGAKRFTADSLEENLERVQGCFTVIAAPSGAIVKVQYRGKQYLVPGANGDFAAPRLS